MVAGGTLSAARDHIFRHEYVFKLICPKHTCPGMHWLAATPLNFKDTLNSKKSGLPDADDFCG